MLQSLHDKMGLRTSPTIFFGSILFAAVFIALTLAFPTTMSTTFSKGSGWIIANLGWFYILGVTVFLIYLVVTALSRFGRIRLSPHDEPPEHSFLTWFAMLFAAGIGTILMFWGVAEPVNHFANPPMADVEGSSVEAAREAMSFTLYHFGLHTWTIFALPSLAFAYFIYQRNLPPRVSSLFHPLLGDEGIHGPVGKAIDIIAIVGTLFGVAVSIALGTLQINAGLSAVLGIDQTTWSIIAILGVVTLLALGSVIAGLEKGIKVLSNANILAAVVLMLFVLVSGPTLHLLRGTIEGAGLYAQNLPYLAFWNDAFDDNPGWQDGWTIFYWAWTITWSPFVGIFIARISQGRTIREFVFGVLAAPVSFSIIWYGIFGFASFDIIRNGENGGELVEAVAGENGDAATALFEFLAHFPLTTFMSVFSIVIVAIFFVTSMDSASLVMDSMARGHDEDERVPVYQRAVWALLVGIIAAVLLTASPDAGITALSEFITIVGLPFFVMGYLMMWALNRAMREDAGELLPLATKQWRKVLPPEEVERRRDEGDEAWATTEVEYDPHYSTSDGQVIAAPETAAYERHDLIEPDEPHPADQVVGSSRLNGSTDGKDI
ncbi:choline/carnitine/betaine transport [Kytococcus aerolatus]|uniref:Choline/carnitine/betaine transport n=1 Tax=Kytococcus aerolatus TaxID=592308 RepID=A0A212U5N4_9MICO|nr:BCCT family transporter [Kytococcus aerolatus]SNC73572.1 choline/carnitine/betaine transport [Kytococcus aerolatus]